MEYPDQLKAPVSARRPGFGALDGFLWEAAAWDPDAEAVIGEVCREGTDAELAEAARRLLAGHVLTEPATVCAAPWPQAHSSQVTTGPAPSGIEAGSLASCAAAEAVDFALIRPCCLAGAAWLLLRLPGGVWLGFLAGKAVADVFWYGAEVSVRRGLVRSGVA